MSKLHMVSDPRFGTGYPGLSSGPARRQYEADMNTRDRISTAFRYDFPLDGPTPIAWCARGKWNVVRDRLIDLQERDPEAAHELTTLLDRVPIERIYYHDEYDNNGPERPNFNERTHQ